MCRVVGEVFVCSGGFVENFHCHLMLVSHFESNESATNCTMRYRANQKLKTVLKTHKGSGEKMHVAKNSLNDLNVIYKSKIKKNKWHFECMYVDKF